MPEGQKKMPSHPKSPNQLNLLAQLTRTILQFWQYFQTYYDLLLPLQSK